MYKAETLQGKKRDSVLCGMQESLESLKKRAQDQCFWCHKVMSLGAPHGHAIWPRKTFMSVYVRWQCNKPVPLLISHYHEINRTRQQNSGPVVSKPILTLVWDRWCKLNGEIWIVGKLGSNKLTVIRAACYSAIFFPHIIVKSITLFNLFHLFLFSSRCHF